MVEFRQRASERSCTDTEPVSESRGGLRISLLGRFEVSVGSRVVQEDGWRLRKAASVVKLLGLARDHRLHREQVMNLLWPDLGTRAAANNLHQALHVARGTIEPEATAYRYFPMRGEHLELCQEDAHGWTSMLSSAPRETPAAPGDRKNTGRRSICTLGTSCHETATKSGRRHAGRICGEHTWPYSSSWPISSRIAANSRGLSRRYRRSCRKNRGTRRRMLG